MAYPEAARLATENARSDSEKFLAGLHFRPRGKEIGEPLGESNERTVP